MLIIKNAKFFLQLLLKYIKIEFKQFIQKSDSIFCATKYFFNICSCEILASV